MELGVSVERKEVGRGRAVWVDGGPLLRGSFTAQRKHGVGWAGVGIGVAFSSLVLVF